MSVHSLTVTELDHEAQHPAPTGRRLGVLTLTALGVVYGDIGTSPLYALRECFREEYGIAPSPAIVVGVKYIVFILRADNRGEGGILALLALLLQHRQRVEDRKRRLMLISLGLFGAAL